MKRLFLAVGLTCAMGFTTLAGEIPSVGTPQPPPSAQSGSSTSPGAIPSDGVPNNDGSEDATLTGLLALIGIAF